MQTLEIALDGYTDLPPGKIASVVTYMDSLGPPEPRNFPNPLQLKIRQVNKPSVEWYRAIYRHIGMQWLWTSRALMSDEQLQALLSDPATEILAVDDKGTTGGFAELSRKVPGEVEIVMFGVIPTLVGVGAAAMLMDQTLRRAWSEGTRRVWLHTCTFDFQGAVLMYQRSGFRARKYAIEVMDDPRLSGRLPVDAGPHVPVIRPGD